MQSIDVGRVVIGNTSITYPTEKGGPPTYSLLWKENGIFCLKVSDKVSKIGRSLSPIFAFMENKTAELDVIMKKGLELDNYLHQLEKCVDDSYLHQTFSYFADAPNWFNLYNTYEMIKFDTDKTLKDNKFVDKNEWKITRLWAEPDEMRRFTRSATDPRAEGGGRHSFAYHENKESA